MSLEGNTNCQQLHKVQEVISHCFSLLKGTLFIELIAAFHFHCKKNIVKENWARWNSGILPIHLLHSMCDACSYGILLLTVMQ